MYDKNGRLTRTAAEQIIRGGGSISIGGYICADASKLPNEADFAKGNKEAEDAARQRLIAQRKALDAQLASLEPASDAPVTAEKTKTRTTAAQPA